MAKRDIAMSETEVDAFLDEELELQVATLGDDGFPHLTTLWFVVMDGLVTFRSFTKSQRVVNLRRNPNLTVLVEGGVGYEELRGVMIKGHARLVEDAEIVIETYRRVLSKVSGTEMDTASTRARFGRFASKNTVVQVEPVAVASWDHRKLAGTY